MRRISFANFFIFFALCAESKTKGRLSTRDVFDIFDDYESSESDEFTSSSMETSRINKQHGEKPLKSDAGSNQTQQPHQSQHKRSDYPIKIYEWLSGKIINKILDGLADYIDDSGILDILNSSEEEIDLYDDVAKGHTRPVMNVTTVNPVTDKTTKNGTSNVTEIPSTTIMTSVNDSTTISSRKKNVTNAIKQKH